MESLFDILVNAELEFDSIKDHNHKQIENKSWNEQEQAKRKNVVHKAVRRGLDTTTSG